MVLTSVRGMALMSLTTLMMILQKLSATDVLSSVGRHFRLFIYHQGYQVLIFDSLLHHVLQ